jgi:hypothetical protein
MYGSSYMFRHYIAILRKQLLVPSDKCSTEKQSIEYVDCYRHFSFKDCNGPTIQVQTLNGLMEIHSFGCK